LLAVAIQATPARAQGPESEFTDVMKAPDTDQGGGQRLTIKRVGKIPLIHGIWQDVGFGDPAKRVKIVIRQQYSLPPQEQAEATEHSTYLQLSDPHTDKTGRAWATKLEGAVSKDGEIWAFGEFKVDGKLVGTQGELPARTMLFGLVSGNQLKLYIRSEAVTSNGPRLLRGWYRHRTFIFAPIEQEKEGQQ
jgi:hypothetical protein